MRARRATGRMASCSPLRERYQIAPGQDDALVLAIAIVIDQMAHATR